MKHILIAHAVLAGIGLDCARQLLAHLGEIRTLRRHLAAVDQVPVTGALGSILARARAEGSES